MSEEVELATRASRGDVDAFCLLIRVHRQTMYRLAFRFCGNHHDAEDLTQEVFLNAFRAIGSFRSASSFKTWLRRIMVNSFLNHKRKTRIEDGEDVSEAYSNAEGGTSIGWKDESETAALNHVLLGRIFDRLREIPPRQRLMFQMKHQENLTSEEIAEHFGTSVGTVKKTVFRVMEQLRREFQSTEPGSLKQEARNA